MTLHLQVSQLQVLQILVVLILTRVHVFDLTNATGKTITIAGIEATVLALTVRSSVTVGGDGIDSKYGPKGDVVQVGRCTSGNS